MELYMPDVNDKKTYIDPNTSDFVTEEHGQVRPATEEEAEETIEQWEQAEQAGKDAVERQNS
jgi:hypothetical protein